MSELSMERCWYTQCANLKVRGYWRCLVLYPKSKTNKYAVHVDSHASLGQDEAISVTLINTLRTFSKKSIEQLDALKAVGVLVSLSGE